ncbi:MULTISPECIES: nitroreductase family protein [Erwiniaceae]|uniref:Nitroreductase family protein n=1 Tax=Pantoea coffeiphila TaxID=1465635 RepID=A0A2S9I9D8_9GAMM|nr:MULTISPECIES: nitroreductase family protein [Erwiniaceae]MCW1876298.1 nitroreductase family protein [Erwinia sp. INIA01]PRD14422.1 nitroreductase family protein [Pantoea coffeiphila]
MKSSVQNAIESRISINRFQADRPLDDETITSLVTLATKAPTAFNMQNWRFIAVRSPEGKNLLKESAWGQQKIVDASVAFIICGTLSAHQQLAAALQPSVDAQIMEQRTVEGWVKQATASHENNAVLQRDEAVRSASLGAMTLMLAAEGMGLGSCPMIGFDAEQVAKDFALLPTELPLMVVVVGYPLDNNWPQKPRKPVADVLTLA